MRQYVSKERMNYNDALYLKTSLTSLTALDAKILMKVVDGRQFRVRQSLLAASHISAHIDKTLGLRSF